MNGISAAARLSALQSDVTQKKHFILWFRKRTKLMQILHQTKMFYVTL